MNKATKRYTNVDENGVEIYDIRCFSSGKRGGFDVLLSYIFKIQDVIDYSYETKSGKYFYYRTEYDEEALKTCRRLKDDFLRDYAK